LSYRLLRRAIKCAAVPIGLLHPRRPGDAVVLLYHRVGSDTSEITVSEVDFERHLAALVEKDAPVSLEAAINNGGGVVVTFDDGYRDFFDVVFPLLVRYRVPATLYLATSLVEGETASSYFEQRRLTWSQLRETVESGLVTVGSHTHSHASLASATTREAEVEMGRAKDLIEEHLQAPCVHFAYPFAVASQEAENAARHMFESAALDAWVTNRRGRIDPHRLGRTPILRSDGQAFFRTKVRGLLDAEAFAYRALGRGPWRHM
jgi:peptidoglycan/xylan/chitin deacetylase (PgdA/CDA1 family)